MKVTKTGLIIVIVCILVIAAACLGWIYSQKLEKQKQLETQLVEANKKLALITFNDVNLQKEQINQKIEKLNAEMASIKTRLITPEDSIDATKAILEDAKSHNIDILNITSPGTSTLSMSGVTLDKLPIEIALVGNIQDIADFAVSLNERFPASIESLIQLDRKGVTLTPSPSDGTPTPTPTPTVITPLPPGFTPIVAHEKNFTGKISLTIYNYEGN
jgi:Tfp pilus assembly protein PilO